MALAACGTRKGTIVYSIDGMVFEVPRVYLLPSRVAWFPLSTQDKALVFSNDPLAPLTDQFAVVLESRKITCRPDKLAATAILTEACSKGVGPLAPVDTASLQREPLFPGNTVVWVYTAANTDGSRAAIASCYRAVASRSGDTCFAFGRYRSLVYSFSLRDRDITKLNQQRTRIESLLAAWER